MDVAGLSPERGARSGAARRSAAVAVRPVRRSQPAAVRAETTRPGDHLSRPAPAVERAAGALAAAAPGTADQLQADYFVRLLVGRRDLIDERVDDYLRTIVAAEARGDLDAIAHFRCLGASPSRIGGSWTSLSTSCAGDLWARGRDRGSAGECRTESPVAAAVFVVISSAGCWPGSVDAQIGARQRRGRYIL